VPQKSHLIRLLQSVACVAVSVVLDTGHSRWPLLPQQCLSSRVHSGHVHIHSFDPSTVDLLIPTIIAPEHNPSVAIAGRHTLRCRLQLQAAVHVHVDAGALAEWCPVQDHTVHTTVHIHGATYEHYAYRTHEKTRTWMHWSSVMIRFAHLNSRHLCKLGWIWTKRDLIISQGARPPTFMTMNRTAQQALLTNRRSATRHGERTTLMLTTILVRIWQLALKTDCEFRWCFWRRNCRRV
jgi:hypothetical protein